MSMRPCGVCGETFIPSRVGGLYCDTCLSGIDAPAGVEARARLGTPASDDPPPPWAAQMAADLVPDERAHEGHSFTSVPPRPDWANWTPKRDAAQAAARDENRRRVAFANLSDCFASLSLIGDAVRWNEECLDHAIATMLERGDIVRAEPVKPCP